MPLRAGGKGETKAMRISTNQLHRQVSHRLRDLDEEWRAGSVAGIEDLDAEVGFRPFHMEDEMVGQFRLFVGQRDVLRAGIRLRHGIRSAEIDHLWRRNAALAQFLAGEVEERNGIAAAGSGGQVGVAAVAGKFRLAMRGLLVLIKLKKCLMNGLIIGRRLINILAG